MEKSKFIYLVTVISTVGLLLSTTNPLFTLLLYLCLPFGLIKPYYLLPVYFIASLSSDYFVASEGIGFTRLLALTIITGVVIKILRTRKLIINGWVLYCLPILAFTFISYLLSYDSSITPIFVLGLNIFIFIAIINLSLSNDELKHLFISILLAVILTNLSFLFGNVDTSFMIEGSRLSIDEDVNANRTGMMMAQLAAFSLAYVFYTKRLVLKVTSILVSGISLFLMVNSGSRSALFGFCMGFLLTFIISMFVQRRITKRLFWISIIVFSAVFLFNVIIELNPMLAYRMNIDQVISSGGTGRWERIEAEIKYIIPTHFFFGVGPSANNEAIALASYLINPGSSHNFIVTSLAQVGILGFLAYMIFYSHVIKSTIKQLNRNEILIIPLMLILTAIFNGIGEVIYSERLFWNAISLAVLCIVTYSRNNIKNNF